MKITGRLNTGQVMWLMPSYKYLEASSLKSKEILGLEERLFGAIILKRRRIALY